jgi:hypothetical protein
VARRAPRDGAAGGPRRNHLHPRRAPPADVRDRRARALDRGRPRRPDRAAGRHRRHPGPHRPDDGVRATARRFADLADAGREPAAPAAAGGRGGDSTSPVRPGSRRWTRRAGSDCGATRRG